VEQEVAVKTVIREVMEETALLVVEPVDVKMMLVLVMQVKEQEEMVLVH